MQTFSFNVDFVDNDGSQNPVNIKLRGCEVFGGGLYCGDLQCTGLTHWKVGELTAGFLGRRCSGLLGKQVLCLGEGLGLCGIVSAKAVGPTGYVLLTDGDEEVVGITRSNCVLNSVEANTHCSVLRWPFVGVDASETVEDILNSGGGAHLPANVPLPVGRDFDVIIGSDVIGYGSARDAFDLLATVARLLKKDADADTAFLDNVAAVDEVEAGLPVEADEAIPCGNARGWCSDSIQRVLSSSHAANIAPTARVAVVPVSSNDFSDDSGGGASHGSVFILGYTRRLTRNAYDIDHVLNFANAIGLDWCVADDCILDIFGNLTDEITMFMEHCVILFTWKRKSLSHGY